MKKVLRLFLIILLLGIIVIQFFPTMKNKSDMVPATDLMQSHEVPSQVATLLHNACYDCHSNNTNYPWYNHIQPLSWFLEGHIKEGKKHLNFSKFANYSQQKQKEKLEHLVKLVNEDKMPLTSYKILHAEARLTDAERQRIVDWAEEMLKDYR